jgi:sugar lactone lactonase YvrE
MTVAAPVGARGSSFPDVIDLPTGIAPEGIAVGNGTEFFTGSLLTGAIYKGNLRTGEGGFINEPSDFAAPRSALGMKHDPRSDVLWVAGAFFGQGYVYDADTGETVAVLELTTQQPTLVNDVVVTRTAAYFTDSFQPVLYKVALNSRGMPAGPAVTLPLTGDFDFDATPDAFNSNGIDATPNGKSLILVNTATGKLYTVDPNTGVATDIDLGGDTLPNGDGIVLDGKTLYVVQNFFNQIAVVHLTPDLSSGVVGSAITSPEFRIPTTAAEFGGTLYAVNARFNVYDFNDPPTAEGLAFEIVRVPKR